MYAGQECCSLGRSAFYAVSRLDNVCGPVEALARAGEEQHELSVLALLVWQQSSDVRYFEAFFPVGGRAELTVKAGALASGKSQSPPLLGGSSRGQKCCCAP